MAFFEPFRLERFFAAHEFSAKHLLCSSDCETISVRELLAMEEGAGERLLGLRLGYTETRGDPGLRADLARLYQGLGADGVFVHAGAEEAILNLCLATLRAGDHVIVNAPCYQSLAEIPRALGCAVSPWNLREAGGRWTLDPDELERLLRAKTRLVTLNMPHNPTGALMPRADFDRVVELCRRAGAILLVDEVYRHLERDPARRLPAACEAYENGVSLNVLSKSAGLAGLRIGWLASRRADILDAVAVVKDYNSICSSGPSEALAGVAARNFGRLAERNRTLCAGNLDLLEGFLARRPGFAAWSAPEGGSIAFPRLGPAAAAAYGGDAEKLALALLADTGVLLLPGAYYGCDPALFRVGYGRKNLPEALAILESWVVERGLS
ncbi:MAG: aminotransferase class I/II-fold pyridoxal phosphate-dependent enzyme [Spirochaetaceae bacterium]|nr:aminotransferase class I/II-fold pyridoxal phosphate-dependent enzyme [Spirochaetaceae bacterium]